MSHAIAWFITPHGFGHGTRATAMMAALHEREPELRFEIFTLFPQWLLDQSIEGAYGYHPLECDVGMAQHTALEIDYPETIARLKAFLPYSEELVRNQARVIRETGCKLVVCDIAPLGVAVAEAAGVPSVMVENFTWDWIYGAYLDVAPELSPFVKLFADYDRQATHRIQTEPIGIPREGSYTTHPVVRKLRMPRQEVRHRLGIDEERKLVMITMGGIGHNPGYLARLAQHGTCTFLMPGQESRPEFNVLGLDFSSEFFHPDLVNASDVVVAKLGYSTFAEVWQAGVPFGYIERERFRESPAIARYIQKHMPGLRFTEQDLTGGHWIDRLDELLQLKRKPAPAVNGADQAAEIISSLLA